VAKAKMKLADIVWDPDIYPRDKWAASTVARYADAYLAGEQLPPLGIEKGTKRLLDGRHRELAIVRANELYDQADKRDGWTRPGEKVDVEFHVVPDNVPIKLYAASLSAKHGDRLSSADTKALARELFAESEDEATAEAVANWLGVSKRTAYNYLSDLIAKKREGQLSQISVLSRLGWTQQEIGEAVKLTQGRISQFLLESADLHKLIKNRLSSGIPVEEVASDANMTLPLAWSIKLDGEKDDAKRLDQLGVNVQPYDVWNFAGCLEGFGMDYPGRIPAQLVAHVLYFYTKPKQLILDPMAGGGTVNDVCLAMGRRCYSYDAHPVRYDVVEHDMAAGWPDRIKKASLIFWDPPYFDKVDKQYGEKSISRLERAKYLAFFEARFKEARKLANAGTLLAFLMSNWDDPKQPGNTIGLWDYADKLRAAKWKLLRQIDCPLSTQQVHPDIVQKKRKSRGLCRLQRSLLICQK